MRRHTMVKWLGIGAIASALALGGVTLERTYAQGTPPAATATATPAAQQAQGKQRGRQIGGALIKVTADVTGLQPKDVLTELRAGKSLAQIAQEKGKTADDIINAVVNKAKARLDQAVASGKLTQDQENQRLTKVRDAATKLVNTPNLPTRLREFRGGLALIATTAEVTGLTPEQVQAERQAGKSLAQIAQENGKTADDIINALRTKGEQRLNQALDRAREAINKVPTKQP